MSASEIRVIRVSNLSSANEAIRIEPRFMRVYPGTVVVWWNKGSEEIKVIFMEGAKCEAGTGVPTGFHVEGETDNCYITAYIASGETSSLRFLSEDIYQYAVTIGGRGTSKGRIVVAEKDIYL
jgi:plastocyanin